MMNTSYPDDKSILLVKTEGNKSLRLRVIGHDQNSWQVTIPFQKPVILTREGDHWSAQKDAGISQELINEIGRAIDSSFQNNNSKLRK